MGDDIAAGFARLQVNMLLAFKCLQGFNLDQGDIPTGAAALARRARWAEIAVAFQAQAGDNPHRIARLGWVGCGWG